MTREKFIKLIKEAYKKVNNDPYATLFIDKSLAIGIVNEVFDEIENRICENCKYYKFDSCRNEKNIQRYWDAEEVMDKFMEMQVSKDFGCNRFEKK